MTTATGRHWNPTFQEPADDEDPTSDIEALMMPGDAPIHDVLDTAELPGDLFHVVRPRPRA